MNSFPLQFFRSFFHRTYYRFIGTSSRDEAWDGPEESSNEREDKKDRERDDEDPRKYTGGYTAGKLRMKFRQRVC